MLNSDGYCTRTTTYFKSYWSIANLLASAPFTNKLFLEVISMSLEIVYYLGEHVMVIELCLYSMNNCCNSSQWFDVHIETRQQWCSLMFRPFWLVHVPFDKKIYYCRLSCNSSYYWSVKCVRLGSSPQHIWLKISVSGGVSCRILLARSYIQWYYEASYLFSHFMFFFFSGK